jgi:hypothetical protein
MVEIPLASLNSGTPYPVPAGARLVFRYTQFTTDGWYRGDVCIDFMDGRPAQRVACNVPALGNGTFVRLLGDYTTLFPGDLPVAAS